MKNITKRQSRTQLSPDVYSVTEVYLESLDCPRSLTVLILMRHGEWDQVANLKATPKDYPNAALYHRAACATDWLRKYPDLPVKVDKEKAAKESWYQSEGECEMFSVRNVLIWNGSARQRELKFLWEVAADFIADVLGPCPLDLTPRFGPGATASDPSSAVSVLDKVSSRPTLTEDAKPFLALWQGTAWERSHIDSYGHKKRSYEPMVVEGNTFFTVNKTALTMRGCAKAPSINVSYQLAVGREIRSRLKRKLSLDLASGQARHGELAKAGSQFGLIATIDSERASDCQSIRLIKGLFNKAGFWYDLLESLREPKTFIDGKWVTLNKWSAMGNGYTFELETLVFLSLCYAVAWVHGINDDGPINPVSALDLVRGGDISVYGDDIIVPGHLANDTIRLLEASGFTVNKSKSYTDGPFRESCGSDFYNGIGVNTPKLKKSIEGPADWFSIHNALKKRYVDQYPNDKNASRVLVEVRNQLPRNLRAMYGPNYLGDRVLHGWFGPQVKARARVVGEIVGPMLPGEQRLLTDANQWVGTLLTLAPDVVKADIESYDSAAQLAYLLYTQSSDAPVRRPLRGVKYKVVQHEDDYYVIFANQDPRKSFLAGSPYKRFFGIEA